MRSNLAFAGIMIVFGSFVLFCVVVTIKLKLEARADKKAKAAIAAKAAEATKREVAAAAVVQELILGVDDAARFFEARYTVSDAERKAFDEARASFTELNDLYLAYVDAAAAPQDNVSEANKRSLDAIIDYIDGLVARGFDGAKLHLVMNLIPLSYNDAAAILYNHMETLCISLCLAIPDKSLSFDERRDMVTSLGDLLIFRRSIPGNMHLPRLPFPREWNQWLCESLLDPELLLFSPLPTPPPLGTLKLRVTKILSQDHTEEKDIVELKMIWAIAKLDRAYWDEIGETHLNALAAAILAHPTSKNFDRISLV